MSVQRLASGVWRVMAAVTGTVLTAMRHAASGGYGYGGWAFLNNTSFDYAGSVRPDASSIVMACVRWIQRVFTEAPPILEQWNAERQEWVQFQRDDMLDLLERPNHYYNGATLLKAIIADRMLTGTAYMVKVRSTTGRVVELWWAPASTMTPMGDANDPTVFISHYEYSPGGGAPMLLRVEDVVRLPDGIDPMNPRLGLSPMGSLMREIFTDDEAANMTASLLRNMGVPGVIISPKTGTIGEEAAKEIKASYIAKTTGDRRGEPLVMAGSTEIATFGFSPEQMQLRNLRGIPEERITAVLGVNSAVVGLGSGLASTKVGATLREYREESFESTIIPMYRELASELTHQLLPDFKSGNTWRVAFDLSKVRVLQDDENKRAERVRGIVSDGLATVAEGRRALGLIALPEHEVYLRRRTLVAVPAGTSPEDQAAMSLSTATATPAPGGNGDGMDSAATAAVAEAEAVLKS